MHFLDFTPTRHLLKTFLALCVSLSFPSAFALSATQPNLVAIVADDLAAWTLGCYGGKEIPTPNLDRLAAEGVRFENAFVHTPVCSPSRATYLTGLLPCQIGFSDWLNPKQEKTQGIRPDAKSWPSVLLENGYVTGLIGKWHVGSGEKSLPWHNGIQEFTGNLGGGWRPDKVNFVTEKGGTFSPPGFSVEICTDLAMMFIDRHKEQPFALLVHYREPHAAYVPMPEQDMESSRAAMIKVPEYPGLKQPYATNERRDYYAAVAALDRNVGRILDHLKKSGLAKNTIVTFTSDHGYNVGEHGIQHKGNGRWITTDHFNEPAPNMFDSSLRIPLLVSGPAVRKPGSVVGAWVTNRDTFPSMLGLLGVAIPADAPPLARDFSPSVRGEALAAEMFPNELFGQYDLVNFPIHARMRMIRTERWKLLLRLDDRTQSELYDLRADPDERHNLFGSEGSGPVIEELTNRLHQRMSGIHDPAVGDLK